MGSNSIGQVASSPKSHNNLWLRLRIISEHSKTIYLERPIILPTHVMMLWSNTPVYFRDQKRFILHVWY